MKISIMFFSILCFVLIASSSILAETVIIRNDLDGDDGGNVGIAIYPSTQYSQYSSPKSFTTSGSNGLNLKAYDNQTVSSKEWFFNDTEYQQRKSEWRWINEDLEINTFHSSSATCTVPELSQGDPGDEYVAILRSADYTTSGTMSADEDWWTPADLTGDVTVANGVTLTVTSDGSIDLNGHSIICEGTGEVVNNGSITNVVCYVSDGSNYVGYHPSIAAALSNASSGQIVLINSSSTIGDDLEVPSGVTLKFNGGTTTTLNGNKITTSTGSLYLNGGSVTPDIRRHSSSGDRKGFYSTISSALSEAPSGQTVYVYSDQTVSSSITVPSGVTLNFKDGETEVDASITTTVGYIVEDGGTFDPDIRVKQSSAIKGLYPAVQSAVTASTSAQNVYVGAGTYTENLNLKSYVGLYGDGMNTTILNGDLSMSSDSYCDVMSMTINGEVDISGGSWNILEGLKIRDEAHADLSASYDFVDFTADNSGYIDLYQCDVVIDGFWSTNSIYYAVYAYEADPELSYGDYRNKYQALCCNVRADAVLDGDEFCLNTCDIYAGTGSDVDASDVDQFSDTTSTSVTKTCGSGSVTLPSTIYLCSMSAKANARETVADVDVIPQNNIILNSPVNRDYAELKTEFLALKKKTREQRRVSRLFSPHTYSDDYQKIIDKAVQVAQIYSSSPAAFKALRLASYCYRALGESEQVLILANDLMRTSPELKAAAKSIQVPCFLEKKQYAQALATVDELVELEKDETVLTALIFRKGVIYERYLNDYDNAALFYSQVMDREPESAMAWNAERRLGKMERIYQPGTMQGNAQEEPLEFAAHNYPNPANPGTSIHYTLPEDGHISIKIYNINGQQVAELLNAEMPAGRHQVLWNGANAAGRAAATGMYFYRLEFEDKVLSHKFLLLR